MKNFEGEIQMEINKLKFAILGTFFLIVGCAKSSDSGIKPAAPSVVPNEVAQKVSDSAKLPDLGDFRTLEFLDFFNSNSATCIYRTIEKTTVSQMSTTTIELSYDRSFTVDPKNIAGCPAQHPSFLAHEVKSWGLGAYSQMKIEAIKRDLDPAEYVKNEWVQFANIISSQELNHNGLRSQLVDMEVVSKKGVKYSYKQ